MVRADNKKLRFIVNDINQCLEQAQSLAKHSHGLHWSDQSLQRAFTSLAGDETIGFLAYAIWRGRSRLLSSMRSNSL
ncbi:MAG TPA: hypothetical protein G4N92_04790 [Anaerolineae bacterium]|nr:hypothetical protein [Anaerolineae bacterium]